MGRERKSKMAREERAPARGAGPRGLAAREGGDMAAWELGPALSVQYSFRSTYPVVVDTPKLKTRACMQTACYSAIELSGRKASRCACVDARCAQPRNVQSGRPRPD
jgi:hypothetical protein